MFGLHQSVLFRGCLELSKISLWFSQSVRKHTGTNLETYWYKFGNIPVHIFANIPVQTYRFKHTSTNCTYWYKFAFRQQVLRIAFWGGGLLFASVANFILTVHLYTVSKFVIRIKRIIRIKSISNNIIINNNG